MEKKKKFHTNWMPPLSINLEEKAAMMLLLCSIIQGVISAVHD